MEKRKETTKRDQGKRKATDTALLGQELVNKKQSLQPPTHSSSTAFPATWIQRKLDPVNIDSAVWWDKWEDKNEEMIAGYLNFETIGDFRLFMGTAIVLKHFLSVFQYLPDSRTKCLELLRDNGCSEDFNLDEYEFSQKYPFETVVDVPANAAIRARTKIWRLAYHVRRLTIACQSSGFVEIAKGEEVNHQELSRRWSMKMQQGPLKQTKISDLELPSFGPHKQFGEHPLEAYNRILVVFHVLSLARERHVMERLSSEKNRNKLVFAKPAFMEAETSPQRCELVFRMSERANNREQPYTKDKYDTNTSSDIWKQTAKGDVRSCTQKCFRDLLRCQFELGTIRPG